MPKYRVTREPVVQPPDQSIRLIALTKGQVTVVDAADYEWLMQWNWYAFRAKNGFYAARFEGVVPNRRMVLMHRALTDEKGVYTDHQDQHTLNNRRLNLRPCTQSQNQSNRKKMAKNTSGFKGVSWSKSNGNWQAQTSLNGVHVHLGHYATKEEAFSAYRDFTIAHKKEFARF
jgi:hypothetical protein